MRRRSVVSCNDGGFPPNSGGAGDTMTPDDGISLLDPIPPCARARSGPWKENGVTSCHRVTGRDDDDARKLIDLAERVSRLVPSHRDPERFWMDKSQLAHELRQIARAMGG